jgi:hypothetical protein
VVLEGFFETLVALATDLLYVRGASVRKLGMIFRAPGAGGCFQRNVLPATPDLSPQHVDRIGGSPLVAGYPVQLVGEVTRDLDDRLFPGHAGLSFRISKWMLIMILMWIP